MDDDLRADQEMERLKAMHETVERLRSQLKTIRSEDEAIDMATPSERGESSSDGHT